MESLMYADELEVGFGVGEEQTISIGTSAAASRLGMTLENVIEATVVHEVDETGAAGIAGMRRGVLVVAVGDDSTSGMLHEEVIERLREPTRPLVLRVRHIEASQLEKRRAEAKHFARFALAYDRGPSSLEKQQQQNEKNIRRRISSDSSKDEEDESYCDCVSLALEALGDAEEALVRRSVDGAAATFEDENLLDNCVAALCGLDAVCGDETHGVEARGDLCRAERALCPMLCACVEAASARLTVPTMHGAGEDEEDTELASSTADLMRHLLSVGEDATNSLKRWAVDMPARSFGSMLAYFAARVLARVAHSQGEQRKSEEAETTTLPALLRLSTRATLEGAASLACAMTCSMIGSAVHVAVGKHLRPLARLSLHRVACHARSHPARAAACRAMGALCAPEAIDLGVAQWILRWCERHAVDAQPCMRRAALDATVALAAGLPKTLERCDSHKEAVFSREDQLHLLQCKLMPLATTLAADASAEVRSAVARRSASLCEAFGPKRLQIIVDETHGLLDDPEVRVRCAATRALPAVGAVAFDQHRLNKAAVPTARRRSSELSITAPCRPRTNEDSANSFSADAESSPFLSFVAPAARLASDPNAAARAALASALGGFFGLVCLETARLGFASAASQAALDRVLFPLALILLNDEETEVASAALEALAGLAPTPWRTSRASLCSEMEDEYPRRRRLESDDNDDCSKLLGLALALAPHHVDKLVMTLQDVATSRHWRARAMATSVAATLVPCSYAHPRSRAALAELCAASTSDVVDQVRRAATRSLVAAATAERAVVGKLCCANQPDDGSWLCVVVLPQLEDLRTSKRQRDRKLSMVLALELASVTPALLEEQDALLAKMAVAEHCFAASSDGEPLVRLGACKILAKAPFVFLDDYAERALQLCDTLLQDADRDVSQLAGEALRSLLNHLGDDTVTSEDDLGNNNIPIIRTLRLNETMTDPEETEDELAALRVLRAARLAALNGVPPELLTPPKPPKQEEEEALSPRPVEAPADDPPAALSARPTLSCFSPNLPPQAPPQPASPGKNYSDEDDGDLLLIRLDEEHEEAPASPQTDDDDDEAGGDAAHSREEEPQQIPAALAQPASPLLTAEEEVLSSSSFGRFSSLDDAYAQPMIDDAAPNILSDDDEEAALEEAADSSTTTEDDEEAAAVRNEEAADSILMATTTTEDDEDPAGGDDAIAEAAEAPAEEESDNDQSILSLDGLKIAEREEAAAAAAAAVALEETDDDRITPPSPNGLKITECTAAAAAVVEEETEKNDDRLITPSLNGLSDDDFTDIADEDEPAAEEAAAPEQIINDDATPQEP